MTNQQHSLQPELGIIPAWAKVLAAVAVLATAIGLPIVFRSEAESPALWLHGLIVIVVSTILAGLILLTGYVNQDAGRRGMSRTLWTVLVIVVPNALGFIIYFLVRQPVLAPCPGCGLAVRPDFNFCPRCNLRLTASCPRCGRGLQPGAQFCVQCGTKLQGAVHGAAGAAAVESASE
ncbi:MAG: zinc ribbon domain-containing protein [Acidobacteriota bacterium]